VRNDDLLSKCSNDYQAKQVVARLNRSNLPVGTEASGDGSNKVRVAGVKLQGAVHVQPLHSHNVITLHTDIITPSLSHLYHSHHTYIIPHRLHTYYYTCI